MDQSERLDELFKYFHSASAISEHDAESQPSTAILSGDPVLNALAQLGACRLGCDRAFVSLISNKSQYVVAESTRNGSLFDARRQPDGGGLAVGVRALDLNSAICATTIPAYSDSTGSASIETANMFINSTRFIINDLSLEPDYQAKPCVQGHPYMRFYAAAAIRSSSGHVIGNYAVIDSRPHAGLDEGAQSILTEIASSVMNHLELLRIRANHENALKLLHGLESFVRSDTLPNSDHKSTSESLSYHQQSDQPVETSPSQDDHPQQPDTIVSTSDLDPKTRSLPAQHPGTESQVKTDHPSPSATSGDSESAGDSPPDRISVSSLSNGNQFEQVLPAAIPDQHQDVLTRASSLISAAMHMDRVFFVNAPCSPGPSNTNEDFYQSNVADTAAIPPKEQIGITVESGLPPMTEAFGHRTSSNKIRDRYTIPEELHAELLSQRPRGAFFNFTNYSRPEALGTDTKARLYKNLRASLPPARSLIFLPLLGPDNKTCVRSMFAWSSEERRVVQEEDLNYFRLFSAAIEAKFLQIETAIQSRAKSDFISSISHELRSPLHGVLGNAELLLNSDPDAEQEDSIVMIQKSGGALLTTLDHILTYSKINTPTRAQTSSSNTNSNKGTVTTDVDLSMVVEDSVDTLIAGNIFRKLSAHKSKSRKEKGDPGFQKALDELDGSNHGPLVNLTIDTASSWGVTTEEAVWVRSVINILGNAMKYTESGLIEIRLQMSSQPLHSSSDRNMHTVKLSVSDTGRGMSSTYLRNHLYHAFSQENTTSDGLGLGLSIVKKLIDGLEGSIDIQSEVGKGTIVEISAPVLVSSENSSQEPIASQNRGKRVCFIGELHKQDIDSTLEISDGTYQRKAASLSSTLSIYCQNWCGIEISHSTGPEDSTANVMILLEDDLKLFRNGENDIQNWMKQHPKHAIVVVSMTPAVRRQSSFSKVDGVFHMLPPFGPRRLASMMQQVFEYTERVSNVTPSRPDPVEIVVPRPAVVKQSIPAEMEKAPTQQIQKKNNNSGGKYVLVVDDNEVNIKILSKCLLKWKIDHETALDGAEAVKVFQGSDRKFDYILMDISMPVMNGIAATRAIRELEMARGIKPRAQIIAMTGLGDDKTRQEAIASGMDSFFTKPIRLGQIKSLLQIG